MIKTCHLKRNGRSTWGIYFSFHDTRSSLLQIKKVNFIWWIGRKFLLAFDDLVNNFMLSSQYSIIKFQFGITLILYFFFFFFSCLLKCVDNGGSISTFWERVIMDNGQCFPSNLFIGQ